MTNLNPNPNNINNKSLANADGDLNRPNSVEVSHNHSVEDPNKVETARDNFQRGYLHGRHEQRYLQEQAKRDRANKNATRGLILGIGLTSLLVIGLGLALLPELAEEDPSTTIYTEPTESLEPEPEVDTELNNSTPTSPPENTTIIENNTRETIRETQVPVPVSPNNTNNQTDTPATENPVPNAEFSPAEPPVESETNQPQELPSPPASDVENQRLRTEPANPLPAPESGATGQ